MESRQSFCSLACTFINLIPPMKSIFFLSFLFLSLTSTAQNFEISGKIVDKENGQPLESATIFVEKVADSSLVTYTITDADGNFVLEGSDSADSLRLVGSYAGYLPFKRLVDLSSEKLALGILEMEFATNMLGEVTVVADRAPVTVKTDTLEFNAGSFSTRPDANLEDVMKKLPGVEVDAQGNITVNGKPVTRILVNGKEFFGNDPKIATKNLPKEIIDKIQVVDTKTKTEEFTGKAGDPDNKTINITIQEDKNHGYFTRATAGGGTDGRYELSGIGNYFRDELRVSVLASSNNINSSGFSFDEVFDAMGGRGRSIMFSSNGSFSINGNSFGGGGGITKSETAGFNFTNEWNEKTELNADYFFGRNDTETHTIVERENFLPDRTYYSNSVSSGNVQNDSHRASASFEFEIDSLTKISFRPRVNINEGFSTSSSMEETLDENRELTNSSSTFRDGNFNNSEFGSRIDFIKRFGSRGAYLQAEFSNNNNISESDNVFRSERITYDNGIEELREQDQFIDEEDQKDEYGLGITQRSVLAENLFLDLSYEFNTENAENRRNVYGLDEETGEHSLLLEDLSNAFEIRSLKHIPNLGLNYEGEKLRAGFDVGLLNTSLETENLISGTGFDRSFNNLYLQSNIRYEIKRGTSARISYRNNTQIPSIRQMQPVADVTNPLNIVVGNPELRPTYSHNINLNYHDFDFATRSGFGSYASISMTEDDVVPVTTTDEDLVRTTTYTNVDGGMNAYVGAYYNKRYKKENSEFSFRLGGNANYNKQIGFTDGEKYNAKRWGFGPSVRLGYNYMELVDLNPRYELNYVMSDYDINSNREEEYMNHSIGFEATTYWPENIVFGNDFSYNYFGSVAAAGFDPTAVLWNMSLGYQFLGDDATLKVKVYDLLNENVSTSRDVGRDYVQDTQQLILEQYFMLSLTYKLSKFGGKDPNENGRSRRF